jgi:hypothetical protein
MRLAREKRTVAVMIGMYCRARHRGARPLGGREPCGECSALLDYALQRIEGCRFGAGKPVCAKCRVHCFAPQRREQIRRVMRYAGPRMLLHHPLLAILHLLDSRRPQGPPIRAKGAPP